MDEPGGPRPGEPPAARPPARRPRSLLVAALALLTAAGAFAAVITAHLAPAGLDRWWLATVHGWQQPWLTRAGVTISYLAGPWGGTVLVAAVVLVLLRWRWWWTALFLALAEAAGSGASQLIKHLVQRPRPPHPLVTADFGSFPSGHVITTVAVGLALTAALARPARRPVWLAGTALAAAIMILTRTYLRAHWLSDTFGSVAVAAGLALLLWWWFAPKLAAERHRPRGRSLDSSSTANHDHA
jgi:undecaprenyl-diphosphatase